MIDLHCHILPGVDDGPDTLEESLAMCRLSFGDGIRTILATPHTLNGVYQNNRSTILAKVKELNSKIAECGLQNADCGDEESHSLSPPPKKPVTQLPNNSMTLRILPGADVHFSPELPQQIEEGKALTIGDGRK